jgi:hypothetical protein
MIDWSLALSDNAISPTNSTNTIKSPRYQCEELVYEKYLRKNGYLWNPSQPSDRICIHSQLLGMVILERDLHRCKMYSKHVYEDLVPIEYSKPKPSLRDLGPN